MTKIFISYRREDSGWATGRIYDRLESRFGSENVFVDIDSIPLGVDFRNFLDGKIKVCDVVIAVIGSSWVEAEDGSGQRRLDSPQDFVRTEIEIALKRNVPLIPVLLDRVKMPSERDLPSSISGLVYRNAAKLDMDSFGSHMDRLIRGLEKLLVENKTPEPFSQAEVLATETPKSNATSRQHGFFSEQSSFVKPRNSLSRSLREPSTATEIERLLEELRDSETRPNRRLQIGDRLAVLGDPRPGVGLNADGLPDIDWVEIPAGYFLYGWEKKRLHLDDFRIARYPVTNDQFQAFIDDGGYRDNRWWTDLAGRPKVLSEPTWSQPNRPRLRVNWFEAVAFCRWLSSRTVEVIRLPTEAEWEKAARGSDGREFPWGPDYQDGWANLNKKGSFVRQTTAVGVYPQGASPYGVLDMAGNVWEWCQNKYDRPEDRACSGAEPRVVRGGSWDYSHADAQCAVRDWPRAGNFVDNLSFRVALSPLS